MPNSLLGFISHQETRLEGNRRNVLNGKVFKQQSESLATKRSFFYWNKAEAASRAALAATPTIVCDVSVLAGA